MNKQLYEYHSVLGYKFIPNLRTRITHESSGYLLKTNNLGFRSEIEFEARARPGKKRILMFGDSFTAGDGVSNNKRFSDLLMKMRDDLEVYNFAISGTGTDQHYLAFREFAKELEHDLVVIMVFVENIKRVNAKYRAYFDEKGERQIYAKPYFNCQDGALILEGIPVAPRPYRRKELNTKDLSGLYAGGPFHAAKKAITLLGLKSIFQRVLNYDPLFEYKRKTAGEWDLMKAVINKWADETPTPVLVVPMPLWQHVEGFLDYSAIHQRFMELSEHKNIQVFDPMEDLQQYTMKERRAFRFKVDVHYTPEGHKAYAKALIKPIDELLPVQM